MRLEATWENLKNLHQIRLVWGLTSDHLQVLPTFCSTENSSTVFVL